MRLTPGFPPSIDPLFSIETFRYHSFNSTVIITFRRGTFIRKFVRGNLGLAWGYHLPWHVSFWKKDGIVRFRVQWVRIYARFTFVLIRVLFDFVYVAEPFYDLCFACRMVFGFNESADLIQFEYLIVGTDVMHVSNLF